MTALRSLSILTLGAFLAGCQGQNPFTTSSNPLKDYPNVRDNAQEKYNSSGAPPATTTPSAESAGSAGSQGQGDVGTLPVPPVPPPKNTNGTTTEKPSPQEPVVTVAGLPAGTLTFEDSFAFKIEIADPESTASEAPSITAINLDPKAKALSDPSAPLLDASSGVKCKSSGKALANKTWEFSCDFMSGKIEGVNTYLKSGRTVEAAFFIEVVGAAPGLQPAPETRVSLKINFPKETVTTKPTTTTAKKAGAKT